MVVRRPLVALAVAAALTGTGCGDSDSTSPPPVPSSVLKVAGDAQSAPAGDALPIPVEVEVRDEQGRALSGETVTFTVTAGGGSVNPPSAVTGVDGRATTEWTLGPSSGAQRLRATVQAAPGITVEFTATATEVLAVVTTALRNGSPTLAYADTLRATGGSGQGLTWTVGSGALPPGIVLGPTGVLSGVPTASGPFSFGARVTDGTGATATRTLNLQICSPPLALQAGEAAAFEAPPPPGCGIFLRAASAADRFRVGVLRPTSAEEAGAVAQVTLRVRGMGPAAAPPGAVAVSALPGSPRPDFGPGLARALEISRATEALHVRLRNAEPTLLRQAGVGSLLPDLRALARAPAAAAPAERSFTAPGDDGSACTPEGPARKAFLVAERAGLMAVYQDSAQRSDSPVSEAHVEAILDYYRDHGKPVIDQYFDGISDINGDGQVVVLITPVVDGDVAAFVWSGDFLTKAQCEASNEMELVYLNAVVVQDMDEGGFLALGTVVHEVKHVSSLYKRVRAILSGRADAFHPSWLEEGTAEIAAEISSRLAWAAEGGPAPGSRIRRQDFAAAGGFTPGNYALVINLARTANYLSSQPNAVTTNRPSGAPEGHSFYGSSWHFHRFLGDAYGGAGGGPLADQAFFRTQNDSLSSVGVAGIEALTGKPFANVLEEYLTAIMLNGTGAPDPARAFTTFDFPTAAEIFCQPNPLGIYPWPVTTTGTPVTLQQCQQGEQEVQNPNAGFVTATFQGSIGPAGVRIHDFVAGAADRGMEMHVEVSPPGRVVVVRLQ